MPRRCSFKLELEFPQPLAGVDEAGCAPLAGPVVAAACILDRDKFPRGIDDSKNLPIEKREALYAKLVKCSAWAVGVATVEEIDEINIYWARMLAMTRAVEALGLEPAWVLVDGNACPKWQRPSKAIVDGDAKCRSIAAASPQFRSGPPDDRRCGPARTRTARNRATESFESHHHLLSLGRPAGLKILCAPLFGLASFSGVVSGR